MLRRRILASAMASVMALSSVAVVANAEDTAVKAVKTKADLEAYVKSFDSFRTDKIYDYGSISGENFLNAIEFADNVLEDAKAGVEDYTAAYDMIKAVYDSLKIYTTEELKALIATCKADYESNNILNEEIGDEIYKNDKNQYSGGSDSFVTRYEDAEAVIGSSDSRLVTDAYELLVAAKAKLSTNTQVTKAQFRAALKAYETAKQKQFEYETWRIGTFSSEWVNLQYDEYWHYSGKDYAYGLVYDTITQYDDSIYKNYDAYVEQKNITKTTQVDIASAYNKCLDATLLLNAWSADDTNRATKSSVQKLIDTYHGQLVYDYAYDKAIALYEAVVDAVSDIEVQNPSDLTAPFNTVYTTSWIGDVGGTQTKLTSAALSVKTTATTYYIPTKDGKWDSSRSIVTSASAKDKNEYRTVNVRSTIDLTSLIDVTGLVVGAKGASKAVTTSGDNLVAATENLAAATESYTAAQNEVTAAKSEAVTELTDIEPKDIGGGVWIANPTTAKDAVAALEISDSAKKIGTAYATKVESAVNAVVTLLSAKSSKASDDAKADIEKLNAEITALNGKIADLEPLTSAWDGYQSAVTNAAEKAALDNALYNLSGTSKYAISLAKEVVAADKDAVAAAEAVVAADKKLSEIDASKSDTETDNAGKNNVVEETYSTNLAVAMKLAELYIDGTKIDDKSSGHYAIEIINDTDTITAAKGSSAEWTLVNRYLKYALSDKYDIAANAKYTKADVNTLIESAYELAEKTGDASLFEANHQKLVTARADALAWVKEANKDKTYKDNSSTPLDKTSTTVYNTLKDAYDALNKDLSAYKYSFQDVYDYIAEVEDMLDSGDITATDDVVTALADTAYRLSTVGSFDTEYGLDNDAFTSDRVFQGNNRVFTWTDTSNAHKIADVSLKAKQDDVTTSHFNLTEAYEALQTAVKAQTEVTVVLGDLNGDGKADAKDAAIILSNIVNSVETDKNGDFDASGVVDAKDAAAILKAIIG